jgi:hypothetical protein
MKAIFSGIQADLSFTPQISFAVSSNSQSVMPGMLPSVMTTQVQRIVKKRREGKVCLNCARNAFVTGEIAEKLIGIPTGRAPGYIPSTIIGATPYILCCRFVVDKRRPLILSSPRSG